ncbi:hypothetical protein IFM89_014695 [Coptis chinensis]|uniref:CCHC-type domain-containing protein n=1 Tax=Coptis chinensis TaxID=261450 RepID=A0A835LRM1_9MAGN|nr:hypothetical protein IFM89_014695 [Coptis chinensis]
MSGACGFVAMANSDKKKGRARINRCGNCHEPRHTKRKCPWPKPQSQGCAHAL